MNIEVLRRKNFAPDEFFYSETAKKHNIDNKTSYQPIIDCLSVVADKIQQVRDLLGKPIKINSAYRSFLLNKEVGGKADSQHLYGQAVDFVCPDFGNPAAVFYFLKDQKIEVDQCLLENTWIHLSIKAKGNRNMWGSYINGIFKPK